MISEKQKSVLLSVVATEYGIPKELILSRSCEIRVLRAKRLLVKICRYVFEMPYEEIAVFLGKTERTTVLHYKNRVINKETEEKGEE